MRALLVILSFGLLATPLRSADLEVTVHGVDEVKGTLRIGLFQDAENFAIHNAIEGSPKVKITEAGPVTVTIEDLEPGIYAVAVIWDWNENEVLDTSGPFKKPLEPYGFSMSPKIRFKPPSFEECTFDMKEPGGKLTVVLIE